MRWTSWFRRPKVFAYSMPGFETPEGRQAQSLGIMLVVVLLFMGSITAGVVALIVPVPPEPAGSGFGVELRGAVGPGGQGYRITVRSVTEAIALSEFTAELKSANGTLLERMFPLRSTPGGGFSFLDINQRGRLDVGDYFDMRGCYGAPEPLQFRLFRVSALSTVPFNDPC